MKSLKGLIEELTAKQAELAKIFEEAGNPYDFTKSTGLTGDLAERHAEVQRRIKELEDLGHVEVSIEPQESRPDKKVYHVTPSGREAFLKWLQTPVSGIRLIRIEFLGKLFLAEALGPEMIERVVDVQLEACQGLLADLQDETSAEGFEDLVLRFRTGQIEAAIDWLEYCRGTLMTISPKDD